MLLHVVVRLELVGEQRNAGGREVSERVRLGSVVQTGRSSGEKLADGVRIGELNGDGPPGENPRLRDGPESSALRMEARESETQSDETEKGCAIYNIGNTNNTAGSGEGGIRRCAKPGF